MFLNASTYKQIKMIEERRKQKSGEINKNRFHNNPHG